MKTDIIEQASPDYPVVICLESGSKFVFFPDTLVTKVRAKLEIS